MAEDISQFNIGGHIIDSVTVILPVDIEII